MTPGGGWAILSVEPRPVARSARYGSVSDVRATPGRGFISFPPAGSGLCGLGGSTTELAAGDPQKLLAPSYLPSGAMRSKFTPGRLEWYLLTTDPLSREQLPLQGGHTSWHFSSALRRRRGGFDDVALYRFAAGFATPGELVTAHLAGRIASEWLALGGSRRTIVLGALQEGRRLRLDVFNTSSRKAKVSLGGSAVAGKGIELTDMLSRVKRTCPGGRFEIPPLAFARVLVQ